MTNPRPSLFSRDDTFLGVCEGLGQDLGVNPLWLRVAFALALFFQPAWVVGGYLALGAVVAASRWLFPDARPVEGALEARALVPRGDNDGDAVKIAKAA